MLSIFRFVPTLVAAGVMLAGDGVAAVLHTLAPTNITATSATFNGTALGTGDLEYLQCSIRSQSGTFASVFNMDPATISGTDSLTLVGAHSSLLPCATQ